LPIRWEYTISADENAEDVAISADEDAEDVAMGGPRSRMFLSFIYL
jgi:hypothetical protein